MPQGEKYKLTEEQKDKIASLQGKQAARVVAVRYNISHTMVYKIWKSKRNLKKPIVFPVFLDIIEEIIAEEHRGFNFSPEKMNTKPYRIIFDKTIQHIRKLN